MHSSPVPYLTPRQKARHSPEHSAHLLAHSGIHECGNTELERAMGQCVFLRGRAFADVSLFLGDGLV